MSIKIKNIKNYYKKDDLERSLFYECPTTSNQTFIGSFFRGPTKHTYLNDYPNKNYKYISKLGDGSASKLYIATVERVNERVHEREVNERVNEQGVDERVVIKKIPKYEEWRTELLILDHIKNRSKRLLSIVDFFESEQYAYIVCDEFNGFDLFEHINLNVPYKPNIASKLIKEMLLCIKDCHDLNVAHLDIKCENFMVNTLDNSEKMGSFFPFLILIDFGHAEKITNDSEKELFFGTTGTYGTCPYLCPEGFDRVFSLKSDIWSIGICAYLILAGDFPFNCHNDDKEYEKAIVNYDLCFDRLRPNTTHMDFIRKCLIYDPRKRPSIDELLNHPFITQ